MASVKQALVKSSTTRNKADYIRIKTRDNIENGHLLFPCNIKIFSVKKKDLNLSELLEKWAFLIPSSTVFTSPSTIWPRHGHPRSLKSNFYFSLIYLY